MGIVGKITSQGFVGNLQGTASFAEQLLNSAKSKGYTADDFAAASHTHSISEVTSLQSTLDGKQAKLENYAASESKWNGASASASSEASISFNPGTGLIMNLTASFAGKTASAKFDASHTHNDKLDVTTFNAYTSSADSVFAGTANSASHAAEIKWSGITGKPTSAVADIDAAVTASHSHSNKSVLDGITSAKVSSWDTAESASKAYAKPAVDYVAASASLLDTVKTKVITSSGSWDKAQENVIEEIKVNGTKVSPVSKSVNIEIPAAAEYTITKDSGSSTYSAVYHLTKDGTAVGEAINIPKDMVVKAAAVITYNGTDTKITIGGVQYDVEGTHVAGKYVVMIVNNAAAGASQIWIDVKDLVDVYTAGNGINVSASNVISAVAKSGDKYIEVTTNGIASKGIDTAINAASASVKSYADTSSENAAKRAIASGSAALNTYTASNNARVSALETATGSLDGRLDSIESKSGSWDSAKTWVGSNSGSLATAASMTQSAYNLTANFRGQTATATINSASYAAKADHAVDATKVVSGSVQMYVSNSEFVFYIPD